MATNEPNPPQGHEFTAYDIYPGTGFALEAAPIAREWMDQAHQRFPYRCLPLAIANQAGWVLRSPAAFRAYWYGGPGKDDVEVRFDGPPDARVMSHFGAGTITFSVPFLFRTPPGINLWVKGPANHIKDGVQPLEGVVEADWLASTFTMNWKITRVCEWVRFDEGEPFCMLVPVPRGLAEGLIPRRVPLADAPDLKAQYEGWQASRSGFLKDLLRLDPDTIKQGWQKDYFRGMTPDGGSFDAHQTRLNLRDFPPGTPPAPAAPADEPGTH
ncbi:MAG: hypothetical protein K2X82_28040 [Gemmataceae bacterium]|nr:hypothetical protein [Gemmataceae bacterium]